MVASRSAVLLGGTALAWTMRERLRPPRRPHSSLSEASSREDALRMLKDEGFCVLRGAVPVEHVDLCGTTEAARGMPCSAAEQRPERWTESAFGRYHRIVFSSEDTAAFAAVERPLLPFVSAFFDGAQDVFRSELQLLTAVPHSGDQIWHSDNRARGLTLIIPLVDFSLDNGATQLLPGSHRLASGARHALDAALQHGPRIACAPLGSVVAYDARTYHRGLGNSTGAPRPALVLRYDSRETPPPGCGPIGSAVHAGAAEALHLLGGWWAELVGGR
mmetsp:Transcript_72972/g.219106  ORF Transcript_72972/g.219106 Transcript_72972/m.219106 type:complete len:275 (+) Transcript_72972:1-825(+)|eukprot:6095579-Prymnesium_polylepis.1